MIARAVPAVLMLVLLAAAPAAAATGVRLTRGFPVAGPVLAEGDRAVWVDSRYGLPFGAQTRGDGLVVRSARRGAGDATELAVIQDPEPLVTTRAASFGASGERLALGVTRWFRPSDPDERVQTSYVDQQIRVAEGAGPFRTLATCDRDAPGLALDDATLLSSQPCEGLVVRRLDAGDVPEPLADGGGRTALAGRFAAWVERPRPGAHPTSVVGDVVVFDLARGAEAYRIAASALPGGVLDLDVQADGKVAVASKRAGRTRVRVGGPGRRLRTLPFPRSELYGVRIARDRVVGQAVDSAGYGLRRLLLVDLRAPARARTLAREAVGAQFRALFDFDGDGLTWVTKRCARYSLELRVSSLRALRRRPARAPRCARRGR
ncbi:MAG TPA: hypothetical protein VF587_14660 [Solirubrobacteraceae bacterium]|jgi:hypothetical protein